MLVSFILMLPLPLDMAGWMDRYATERSLISKSKVLWISGFSGKADGEKADRTRAWRAYGGICALFSWGRMPFWRLHLPWPVESILGAAGGRWEAWMADIPIFWKHLNYTPRDYLKGCISMITVFISVQNSNLGILLLLPL